MLRARLREVFEHDRNEKVLIFTEFRDTQQHLRELLTSDGWNVHVFHGQLSPEQKDSAVDQFRDGTGPRILISTEAGGEGRNFQFCHVLVNYDLPWNPMRVEQRIGRVDRIGQSEVVQIFNLWVKGTVEERVLNVLERRINVFEQTVGGLDPILGDTENNLRKILLMGDEDRDRALTEFEKNIEHAVIQARRADEQLRDLIMDTKSFRREIAERICGNLSPITPQDQERFIGMLLADVRTHIGAKADNEYPLHFHDPFASDHPEFFHEGRKRRAVFRADERRDNQNVEFFAFGHPIVETIVEDVLETGYEGVTGSRRIRAGSDLAPGTGWLFVYQLSVPGPRPRAELLPVFIDDDGSSSVEIGRALMLRATRFDKEQPVPIDTIPLEREPDAQGAAEAVVGHRANELEAEVTADAERVAALEREKFDAYFDYRELAAAEKIDSVAETLARLKASDDPAQRQIIPVWEANLDRAQGVLEELREERQRKLQEIEKIRHPAVDYELVSAGRIEIIGEELIG